MSIEFQTTWYRNPNQNDLAKIVDACAQSGTILTKFRGKILAEIVLTSNSTDGLVDVTCYVDEKKMLVSFHAGTRQERAKMVGDINRVLLRLRLGTSLEEE